MQFRRLAVYDLGPAPLADFGAAWLGWDAAKGLALPATGGPATEGPRRYGFHATIKAPFRLADGATLQAVGDALDNLAESAPPLLLPGLAVVGADGFISLRPPSQPAALTALAARVVQALDPFRAPLTEAEIARRDPDRLTEAQRANLTCWGYPFVVDDFRYHMTLTGPVAGPEAEALAADLAARLDGLLPDPHPLDALALMGEDADGRFHLIRRATLRG